MNKLPLGPRREAWVDDADFQRFGHLKWRTNGPGRVSRDGELLVGRTGIVFLDRLIVGATSLQQVKHRNRIEIDCRRENLETVPAKPGTRAAEMDMDLCVLRFREAFPNQQRFLPRDTRQHMVEVRDKAGMAPLEFLARIEAWAAARSHIAPWDLERPAPIIERKQAEDCHALPPTIFLPEPSAQQRAWVRTMNTPWTDDGTA